MRDTFVAVMAGIIIFPACFSYGVEVTSGPSLIFVTLPNVFTNMAGGRVWGSLFFLFMTFASFSTVIAVIENIMSSCMDLFGWSRKKAALINGVIILIASVPCVLGYNVLSDFHPIGGRDVREYTLESLMEQVSMVFQRVYLFQDTIYNNIAMGRPDATREEIELACREAYCDHFIRTMPDGYDTLISEDTTNLSGGQKQLLTIARALLASRPLLILDEATSNVDTRTEILVQKAMDKLMKGRTCFVIAHRLSTIVDADLILVLNHGHIVEQGTHAQLLAKKGFYYDLYTSQYAV